MYPVYVTDGYCCHVKGARKRPIDCLAKKPMKLAVEWSLAKKLFPDDFNVKTSDRKSKGLMCIIPRPSTCFLPHDSDMVTYRVDVAFQNRHGPRATDESTIFWPWKWKSRPSVDVMSKSYVRFRVPGAS